ncbi:MAG: hypothetical protein ACRBFS_22555 [Aureispira sp.]
MQMKHCIIVFFLLIQATLLSAQTNVNVYYIRLNELLIYVLPFYAVTIAGLGLFIQKLVRPNFPAKWLYICSIIGILGAGLIAYKFKEIRTTQLPSVQPSEINMQDLSPELKEQIWEREKSDMKETIANYWVVAIPNFILLFLGMAVDWGQRKEQASKE